MNAGGGGAEGYSRPPPHIFDWGGGGGASAPAPPPPDSYAYITIRETRPEMIMNRIYYKDGEEKSLKLVKWKRCIILNYVCIWLSYPDIAGYL